MKKNKITPFIEHFKSGKTISVNGADVNFALYNAIISKRDLGLWKVGMKPHRHWKVTDVKKFFGFTRRFEWSGYEAINLEAIWNRTASNALSVKLSPERLFPRSSSINRRRKLSFCPIFSKKL